MAVAVFQCTEIAVSKSLPHYRVYTRVAVSNVHGVGVRAILPIKKGRYVFHGDDDKMRWIHRRSLKNLPRPIRKMYDDFCVEDGQWFGCPQNFNRMTAAWYLNSSRKPNVAADGSYRFYALRDIKKGEELTVDYATYNRKPGDRRVSRRKIVR